MGAIDKYNTRVDKVNSLVCVGLDSDLSRIPQRFKKAKFPQFEFNKWIIDETHEHASAYKPNIAFYEARGDKGIKELKMTMEYLQTHYPDILTICDAKRGDIALTNQGYVTSLFDWFGFDAVTLSPYLGKEALEPFLTRKDKGCIILCKTSNPGGGEFQNLEVKGKSLWQIIVKRVYEDWNANNNCMLVVGATYPKELKMVRSLVGDMTFLVPGIGAQGGSIEATLKAGQNAQGKGMIINSSRSIIFSDNPQKEARKLKDEVNRYRKQTE